MLTPGLKEGEAAAAYDPPGLPILSWHIYAPVGENCWPALKVT